MSTDNLPDKPEMHFKFFGIAIAGKSIPVIVCAAMVLVFLGAMRIYGH